MNGLSVAVDLPGRLRAQFDAAPGDVIAVLGPNGSGKSTLLGAIVGTVPATSLVIDGVDLTRAPIHERGVGHLAQDIALFPHLDALGNVAFGPRSRGARRADAAVEAYAWLERLGVADLARRRVGELSGGQAQRVALARALASRPAALLLDEPFSSLDVGVAAGLRLELARHLAAYEGVTLLVTHDAADALTMADRVVVLEEGRIAQVGSPHEVAAMPRTAHVARLAGLNVVELDDERITFRPSDVAITLTEPHGSPRLRWRGRVAAVVPHGDVLRLSIDSSPALIADVTAAAATELGLAPGVEVWGVVKATAAAHHALPGDKTPVTDR